ncbi:hypothetical protein GOP47_0023075 [Adiantum capillus-veneris]|uniref:F-box domain-containing protein n=1 Tax=Adiantum capillus-veneris TaxID=13818 RepID=A0A9D4U8X9_ADICA|nr:hypothetical protein GOP47_0023075 [Adiantum capillus-veneris]
MLDGQGCLLHIRHGPSHILSSCSDHHKSCCAESSAESSPNPSAYPLHRQSRSDVVCPCSLDASESNVGGLLTLNPSKSVACHCSPVYVAEGEPARAWDRNGDLAGEVLPPSMSLECDCLSTGQDSSVSPDQGVETGTLSIHGELDEVGTNLCMSFHRASKISRSVHAEGRRDSIPTSNEIHRGLVDSTSCNDVAEDESVGTVGEGGSNCGTDKFQENCMHEGNIGCIFPEDLKETDDSSSESACTEENLLKESSMDMSVAQFASSEFAQAESCKRLRISRECGSLGSHREMPSESHDDNTNNQDQSYLAGLPEECALRCLASVQLFDLGRLAMLGRRYRDLVKSRLIFKLRRLYDTVEHLVFIYGSLNGGRWTVYDANHDVWRTLPPANVDPNFNLQDRESLSAGTHLLWLGKVIYDFVYYRYNLLTNSWERGPSMVNPRCLFASASCGEYAYVAGGFGPANNTGALTLLNSAERYNSATGEWEGLPPMCTARHKCSGFFMDGKFYVIGGRDANHQPIMSGEEYNPVTGFWQQIPNMYFAPEVHRRDMLEPSPPLVAVVNNNLYAVENTTNILKMYNKLNNTWSNLGYLPVRADLRNGWGVAFKALGNRLFVMGELDGVAAFCWQPGANPAQPIWELLCRRERGAGSFLYNCAVMTC